MPQGPDAAASLASALEDARWRWRVAALAALAVAAMLGALAVKPIVQPEAYHNFHDGRHLLGVPNLLNVASNLPFLLVGLLGLRWLALRPANLGPELRPAYALVFAGLAATAVGSAYYHWAPTTQTLFWDRLPIAVSFTALYAAVLAERIAPGSRRLALGLLAPLALFGALSVFYWRASGDLRLYALAQFFPVLTIPLVLWLFPARYSHGGALIAGIGFYAAAKLFEELDGPIFALGQIVSGHTLKHLTAALGAWWIYRMLRERSRLPA